MSNFKTQLLRDQYIEGIYNMYASPCYESEVAPILQMRNLYSSSLNHYQENPNADNLPALLVDLQKIQEISQSSKNRATRAYGAVLTGAVILRVENDENRETLAENMKGYIRKILAQSKVSNDPRHPFDPNYVHSKAITIETLYNINHSLGYKFLEKTLERNRATLLQHAKKYNNGSIKYRSWAINLQEGLENAKVDPKEKYDFGFVPLPELQVDGSKVFETDIMEITITKITIPNIKLDIAQFGEKQLAPNIMYAVPEEDVETFLIKDVVLITSNLEERLNNGGPQILIGEEEKIKAEELQKAYFKYNDEFLKNRLALRKSSSELYASTMNEITEYALKNPSSAIVQIAKGYLDTVNEDAYWDQVKIGDAYQKCMDMCDGMKKTSAKQSKKLKPTG